ncbi:MAG: HD domain-containing protein, partial [Oscillospiraceae bacterium]|nr:HD domain-containing protein [Oscillospiraceae bacterium]
TVLDVGRIPHPVLTEAVCMALLQAAGTPAPVIAHCRAAAGKAMQLADRAETVGAMPNRGPLYTAALLHDIARTEPNHAAVGAAWLRTLGYPEIAEIIARHHDWEGEEIDDAALLFLADKYLQGDREVTLSERFAMSRARCITPEALQAHSCRLEAAERIENTLNRS